MGLWKRGGKGKAAPKNDSPDVSEELQENHAEDKKAKKRKPLLKKKEKKEKQEKRKGKAKKSFFGGKKQDLTLIERMQLEESVAAASLDVVQELANSGESAVREIEEGLLIVAITNEMLEAAELDPSGEEFGSFTEALRSETIESVALAGDLEDGVIGIIPSQETLSALDEYDFAQEMAFKWAIVPFDLEDDDRLTILDSDVHLDRLVELANDPSIQLEIKNGEVVEIGASEDDADYEEDGVTDDDDDDVDEEVDEEVVVPDNASIDADEDESNDEDFDLDQETSDDLETDLPDSFDTLEDEPTLDELDDEPDEPDVLDTDLDALSDAALDDLDSLPSQEDDEIVAEETKEAINRVAEHVFNNTELDLKIDMTVFDDYFDSVSIARFDTEKQDDSELQNVIAKLRQDANVELQRFHQENIQALRTKYATSMRDIHNKLVESLDHKNESTTYGQKFYEIEHKYDAEMDDLDRLIAEQVEKIQADYNRDREEFAENARREALAVYDSRYKDARDKKISAVRDHVQMDLKTKRDIELGELYNDRRTVAKRLFDKATTALLQKLQEEYQDISRKELQMYDAFRKDMDVYLRKHFADEVLRAKAEAEKLRQSHEAERVRNEYEQMLLAKTRQLEEADNRARESLRQLERTHKEELEHIKADYERRIEREKRDNQELRHLLQESNQNTSKISEQKEKEVEHRMKLYEDALKAKEKELEYANERLNKAQRPMKFIIGAVAAIALALGIIFGFLFGIGQTKQMAPGSTQTQDKQNVSLIQEAPNFTTYLQHKA